MLVLTRRTGDSVVIDGQIVVTVLEVRGDVVRLGVDAPREIQVHRAEVYRAVQEANRGAVVSDGAAPAALKDLVERRARTETAQVPPVTTGTDRDGGSAGPSGSPTRTTGTE